MDKRIRIYILLTALLAITACSNKNNPTGAGTPSPVSTPIGTSTMTQVTTGSPTDADTATITLTPTITETGTITGTITETPTDFVPPTITVTFTITSTQTVSPTFTVTMTETPFILDDFADNDIYNNINPPDNPWSSFANTPDAASNTYTIFDFEITSAGHPNYGVMAIGTSHADNPDGSGNFFTTYGISTTVLFAPSTGINFNIYRHLLFDISAYIWTPPSAGVYAFKVKLADDSGRIIEQNFTGFTLDQGWYSQSLDISAFTVPAGVSAYTAADVLPNIVEIRWEYGIVSSLDQDYSESTFKLDNIALEK